MISTKSTAPLVGVAFSQLTYDDAAGQYFAHISFDGISAINVKLSISSAEKLFTNLGRVLDVYRQELKEIANVSE